MNYDELLVPVKEKKDEDRPSQEPLRIEAPRPQKKPKQKQDKEKRVIIIEI